GAGDLVDVDAELARKPPHRGRRGRRRHLGSGGRLRRRTRAARDVDDFRSRRLRVAGLLGGWPLRSGLVPGVAARALDMLFEARLVRGNLRGGVRGDGAAAALAVGLLPLLCLLCLRRGGRRLRRLRRGGRRGRAAFVHRQDRLADLHLLAGLHLDVLHLAGDRRGHFDGRLVGLELEDRLILLQRVARFDEHAQHVAGRDVLAEFGEIEVGGHVSLSLWKRTADTKDTAPESTRRPWCRFYPWCPLYTSCPLYPSYPLCPSRNSRIHFLRVDVVGLDRLVDDGFLDLPVARQRGQRPDDHVPVVDLEEIAQPRAVLAAAE